MALLVRAFPVKSKKAVMTFIAELKKRAPEARHFFSEHGVRRETWHFQQTAHGAIVIAVTDVHDPEAAAKRFAKADAGFAAWFKGRVLEISGVDENKTPLGPETEQIFEFED